MATQADRVARVRSLVAAFNRRDAAGVAEHLAADVIRNRGDGTSMRGRDEVAACLQNLFELFPETSLTPTHLLAIEPDIVVSEWLMDATYETGRAVRIAGANVFRFNANGEIESDEARVDTAALVDQVSSQPGPSPAPKQVKGARGALHRRVVQRERKPRCRLLRIERLAARQRRSTRRRAGRHHRGGAGVHDRVPRHEGADGRPSR